MSSTLPEFKPHPLFRGGHAQTLAGAFLPWRGTRPDETLHQIELSDGDIIVVHDAQPENWQKGDRVVLLLHGLAGSYESGYMIRITRKLYDAGLRVFCLDHRDCGAGSGLAKMIYTAGSKEDVLKTLEKLIALCPSSPIGIAGFSLSGNILLNVLGQAANEVPSAVDRCIAVNPPIDLERSVRTLDKGFNRVYDKHFVTLLGDSVKRKAELLANVAPNGDYKPPKTLFEFDDLYTSILAGYRNAIDYYSNCSANQFVSNIKVKTLIQTAADDPMVPVGIFESLELPNCVTLNIAKSGGHLGYVAKNGNDPDRRWLDWRVVEWMKETD